MILVAQYLQHIDWEDWVVCVMTAIRADTKIDLPQTLLGMSCIMYVDVSMQQSMQMIILYQSRYT